MRRHGLRSSGSRRRVRGPVRLEVRSRRLGMGRLLLGDEAVAGEGSRGAITICGGMRTDDRTTSLHRRSFTIRTTRPSLNLRDEEQTATHPLGYQHHETSKDLFEHQGAQMAAEEEDSASRDEAQRILD